MEIAVHPKMSLPNTNQSKRVLALIPARGGSKGLPRKNILKAAKWPLIAWTITAAQNSVVIDKLILSSEDDEIIEIAREWGCDVLFKRPFDLAGDAARSVDVVLHALKELPGYEYLILLQPTSPLRLSRDIDAAFDLMIKRGATSCVSVCEADQSPYLMYDMKDNGRLYGLLAPLKGADRRQDLPPAYILNGAIYIIKVDQFLISKSFVNDDTVGYEMSKERSIDIDCSLDFEKFLAYVAAHNITELPLR